MNLYCALGIEAVLLDNRMSRQDEDTSVGVKCRIPRTNRR